MWGHHPRSSTTLSFPIHSTRDTDELSKQKEQHTVLDEAHAELKARLASTEERLFHAEERLSALQVQHAELEEKRDALQSDLGVSVAYATHSSIVLFWCFAFRTLTALYS